MSEEVIFRYNGLAYNRPLCRGLCMSDGKELVDICENLPGDAWLEVEIVVKRATNQPTVPDTNP